MGKVFEPVLQYFIVSFPFTYFDDEAPETMPEQSMVRAFVPVVINPFEKVRVPVTVAPVSSLIPD